MYDVIIIGAGVIGASVARELSRYQVKACVLEREEDVCCGTSKANSGIVHAGYDAMPGTQKAKFNLLGNKMMGKLSEELDIPFQRKGSLVICNQEAEIENLQAIYRRGVENGVQGLQILTRKEVLKMEPQVSDSVVAALYASTAGIVCPFELNLGLAENAYDNGIEFHFQVVVEHIEKQQKGYRIHTNQGTYETYCVVNAAGVYADWIHNMVSEEKISITPRRGEYYLLDKMAGAQISRTVFALPGKMGKGVLVTPTIHGNLLIGPTAMDIEEKEGTNTTGEGLSGLLEKAGENVRDLPLKQVITSFAGLRAHERGDDFIIGEIADAKGFIDCAGIESPGLTASPAIGVAVAQWLQGLLQLKRKEPFSPFRKSSTHMHTLSIEEQNARIRKDPAYGHVICRCEMVTEGEIIEAVRRPLGATSLDGIKRRTRAGMGRCQSGFCSPKVMDILAKELAIPLRKVTKAGVGSELICGENKATW